MFTFKTLKQSHDSLVGKHVYRVAWEIRLPDGNQIYRPVIKTLVQTPPGVSTRIVGHLSSNGPASASMVLLESYNLAT